MATTFQYQVHNFEKKPSGNLLPMRSQLKNKILSDGFSAIIRSSRKEQEKENANKAALEIVFSSFATFADNTAIVKTITKKLYCFF